MERLRVEDLRRRTSDFVTRAEAGEAFVVLRHGRPLAVLRAASTTEQGEEVAASRFRSRLARVTRRARRRRVHLTYRGRPVAALGPVPARVRRRHGSGPSRSPRQS